MGFIEFVLNNKWVILFYLVLALIVFLNRKKFEVQAKFIFLYKTRFGISYIARFAKKYKEWIKLFGYTGMGVGFMGMIAISYLLLRGLYDLVFVPSAPPTISPFVPGVAIPGSPLGAPPFFEAIIALFIVVVIHEFSHGIVAKSYDLNIKNTGFVLFGPLPGAFVEPDEKSMAKKSDVVQHSIFAAGPFSNILTGLLIFLIISFFFVPGNSNTIVQDTWHPIGMAQPEGVRFGQVVEGTPAEKYGLETHTVYTQLNGMAIDTKESFSYWFARINPGEEFTLTTQDGREQRFIAGANPGDDRFGYLGVKEISTEFVLANQSWLFQTLFDVLSWLGKLLFWIFLISFGLGLANLLPIGPVDGGRMLHTALVSALGKKKGVKVWSKITALGATVLIVLLVVPILKSILGF